MRLIHAGPKHRGLSEQRRLLISYPYKLRPKSLTNERCQHRTIDEKGPTFEFKLTFLHTNEEEQPRFASLLKKVHGSPIWLGDAGLRECVRVQKGVVARTGIYTFFIEAEMKKPQCFCSVFMHLLKNPAINLSDPL